MVSSGATDQPLIPLLALGKRADATKCTSVGGTLSDEDLLLRMERGDRSALEYLFDRYSDIVRGIGFRVLRDRTEAEDLVQEVFLQLWGKVKGFDPNKGSGRLWIANIAYRRAFDRRMQLHRRGVFGGTDIESVENTLVGAADTEEQLADIVTGEQLHAAFEQLNERQQATLEMYFFGGLNLREISEQLGETLENTRHHYYRGLRRLRALAAAMGPRTRK